MSAFASEPRMIGMSALSVVLVVPQLSRRKTLAAALSGPQVTIAREIDSYPSSSALSAIVESDCDVVIIDADQNADKALDLVESVGSEYPAVTVMIYTSRHDPELLVRCMRAGAREVLMDPLRADAIAEAVVRAAARKPELRRPKKTAGKVLVFVSAKGGCGATTIASNLALALARESSKSVVLADFNAQLGDAALCVGLNPQFSTADALKNDDRLDAEFLQSLLVKHTAGLSLLASADRYQADHFSAAAYGKLVRLLRDDFAFVVVDAGIDTGALTDSLFDLADTIYLVSEVSVPALRNSNRILAHMADRGVGHKVEVVLNRFEPSKLEIDEARIEKALGEPGRWKLPNDFSSVRRAQNTGEPLSADQSPLARMLVQMARTVCGKPVEVAKKKKFGLF